MRFSQYRRQAYIAPFSLVLLRWPLYPGSEAVYIFFLPDKHVFVSVKTGAVSVQAIRR